MKITIEAAGTELTPALKIFIESKLKPLVKLVEKLEGKGEAEIVLEVSRTTRHHHKGLVFRAKGNLKFGKTLLRAEANGESIRAAVDILKDELKREIVGFKERFSVLAKRGARSAKKYIRLSKDARF
ncbi:MAG: ribosomal subunit interface protein [Candidatus Liptonbacteria bacterium RIFCSPLOWO2_01_FULL_45_15]|uniref:Ribosomal subunit interface protein n=1 Tax=Candidatus Liptonbacteria bacterium RIFCSPLOWO2_01_FULL_45_15 TaxID=1798649 RepID=A0A1G2CBS0_9BACT|nr:MAG: ribosomal subunit interface protein [Candidatus Liptonbacteria bacterium RIFCSPLOWO2_01_FULL_45_15]